MRKIYLLISAIAMTANLTVNAQTALSDKYAYEIKNEGFSHSKIEELAQFMTDNMGPRLAASQLNVRAEKMVIEKLKELGLSNPRAEYACDFEKGGWDNKMNYAAMTAPYYCSFAANPKAWSGSTDGLVKGECVLFHATTMEEVEALRTKLEGNIAVMPISEKYEMKFEPLASRWTDKDLAWYETDSRAASISYSYTYSGSPRGDAQVEKALMDILKEGKMLAIVRGSGTFNISPSQGVSYKVGDPEPTPEILIPIEDHSRMVRMMAKGEKVEMELNIKNEFTDNQRINNVIAEIPGTDRKLKDEVVLIGAHFDSWHGGTGAADNASGCVVMIEAMRIIKALGIEPKRTIRLALWGGEEQGLLGSSGYMNAHLVDLVNAKKMADFDNFALYLNMDNGSGRFRGICLEENDMAIPFFEVWSKPLKSLGFTTLSLQRKWGTDHQQLSYIGFPAYQFIQDPLEYNRTYHTPMDTYERLLIDDLRVNAVIVAWLALSAAMDEDRIPLKPTEMLKRIK